MESAAGALAPVEWVRDREVRDSVVSGPAAADLALGPDCPLANAAGRSLRHPYHSLKIPFPCSEDTIPLIGVYADLRYFALLPDFFAKTLLFAGPRRCAVARPEALRRPLVWPSSCSCNSCFRSVISSANRS